MAWLVVHEGRNTGAAYLIPSGKSTIVMGRRETSDVQILDQQASRNHVEISREGKRFMIRDLGSSNGTYYKNMKLVGTIELRPSAKFRIGATVYEFLADPGEVPEDALNLPADALEIIPPAAVEQQRKRANAAAAVVASQQAVPVDGATPLPSQLKAVDPPQPPTDPQPPREGP